MHAPPNGQVWHKAFFWWVWAQGRRSHAPRHFPKMPTAPSTFPLLGAPQAPGDKPNLPEGSKSRMGRPPEAEGNLQVPRHTRPDQCQTDLDWLFIARPTLRASMAPGLFLGGTGRRAVAHTRREFPKMPTAPVGIPLIRGASGAGR